MSQCTAVTRYEDRIVRCEKDADHRPDTLHNFTISDEEGLAWGEPGDPLPECVAQAEFKHYDIDITIVTPEEWNARPEDH